MSSRVFCALPEAMMAAFTGWDRAMSVVRAERTWPTLVGRSEWNMPMRRVAPSSTSSSIIMSAWFAPYCGSPLLVFSIFT
jgi:hypothetical protein